MVLSPFSPGGFTEEMILAQFIKIVARWSAPSSRPPTAANERIAGQVQDGASARQQFRLMAFSFQKDLGNRSKVCIVSAAFSKNMST